MVKITIDYFVDNYISLVCSNLVFFFRLQLTRLTTACRSRRLFCSHRSHSAGRTRRAACPPSIISLLWTSTRSARSFSSTCVWSGMVRFCSCTRSSRCVGTSTSTSLSASRSSYSTWARTSSRSCGCVRPTPSVRCSSKRTPCSSTRS